MHGVYKHHSYKVAKKVSHEYENPAHRVLCISLTAMSPRDMPFQYRAYTYIYIYIFQCIRICACALRIHQLAIKA